MRESIEERIGREVGRRMAARGVEAGALERAVGLPPGAVGRLVAGREALDLGRLERVLGAVGTTPSEFFAALYGTDVSAAAAAAPEAPAPPAGAGLQREEVEHLVREVRTALRTLLAEVAGEA